MTIIEHFLTIFLVPTIILFYLKSLKSVKLDKSLNELAHYGNI